MLEKTVKKEPCFSRIEVDVSDDKPPVYWLPWLSRDSRLAQDPWRELLNPLAKRIRADTISSLVCSLVSSQAESAPL